MENEIDNYNQQIRQLASQNKRNSIETTQFYYKIGLLYLQQRKLHEAEDNLLKAKEVISLLSTENLLLESEILSSLGELCTLQFEIQENEEDDTTNNSTNDDVDGEGVKKIESKMKKLLSSEEYYLDAIMKRFLQDRRVNSTILQLIQKLIIIFQKLKRPNNLIQQLNEAKQLIEEKLQQQGGGGGGPGQSQPPPPQLSSPSPSSSSIDIILLTFNEIAVSFTTEIYPNHDIHLSDKVFLYLIQFSRLYLPFNDITTSRFLNNYAESLRSRRLFSDSVQYHEEALTRRRELTSEGVINPLFLAETCNNLGLVYRALGQFDKSETVLIESLTIRKDQLNSNGLVASTLNNIAELYRDKGNYPQAILYHETAITMYEKLYGLEHPSVINAKGNMGITIGHYTRIGHQLSHDLIKYAINYLNKNNYKLSHPWMKKFQSEMMLITAEEYTQHEHYDKSLEILNQILVDTRLPEQSDVIISLKKQYWMIKFLQAKSFYKSGKYQDGIDLFKYCVDHHVPLYDSNEGIICEVTYLQAENLRLSGEIETAITIFETLLKVRSTSIGNGHPVCAQLIHGLAMCSYDLQKYSESKSYFLQAMSVVISAIEEKFTDDLADNKSNHLLLASIYSNYSLLQLHFSFYSFALQKQNDSLEIRRQYLAANDLLIADSLLIRAEIYYEMGQYDNVETDLNEIARVYKENYPIGLPHPRLLLLLILQIKLIIKQNKYEMLKQSLHEINQMRDVLYGPNVINSLTIEVLYLQGYAQYSLGNYRQVTKFLSKAITQNKKLYGQYGVLGGRAAYLEGVTFSLLGNYKLASTSYRESIAILEYSLGKYHPTYIQAVIGLARNMCDMGSYPECEQQFILIQQLIQNRNDLISETSHMERYSPDCEYFESLPIYLEYLIQHSHLSHILGRYVEANQFLSKGLSYTKEKYGMNSSTYSEVMFLQLENMRAIGENLETLSNKYEENIIQKKKYYPSDHPCVIESIVAYRHYCLDYYSKNQKILLLCRTELLDALLVISRTYSADSLMYASISCALGRFYLLSKNSNEAQKYLMEAMKIYEEIFSGEHILIAECLLYMSENERLLNNRDACEATIEKSMEMFTAVVGYNHPQTIHASGCLGLLWMEADHTLTPGLRNIKNALDKLQQLNFNENHCWIVELKAGLSYLENHILVEGQREQDDRDGQEGKDDNGNGDDVVSMDDFPLGELKIINPLDHGDNENENNDNGNGIDDDDDDALSLTSVEKEIVNLELSLEEKNEIIAELVKKCSKYEEMLGLPVESTMMMDQQRPLSPVGVTSLNSSRRPSKRLEQKMLNDVKSELEQVKNENQKLQRELISSQNIVAKLQSDERLNSDSKNTVSIDPNDEHNLINFAVSAMKNSLASDQATNELRQSLSLLEMELDFQRKENENMRIHQNNMTAAPPPVVVPVAAAPPNLVNDQQQQQQLEQLEASLRELKESKILIESLRAQLDAALTSLASIPQSQSSSPQTDIALVVASTSQTSFPRPRNPNLEAEVNEAMSFLFSSSPDHSQATKKDLSTPPSRPVQHQTYFQESDDFSSHLVNRLSFIQAQYEPSDDQEVDLPLNTSNTLQIPDEDAVIGLSVTAMKGYLQADETIKSLQLKLAEALQELKELHQKSLSIQPDVTPIKVEEDISPEAFISVSLNAIKGYVRTQDRVQELEKELESCRAELNASKDSTPPPVVVPVVAAPPNLVNDQQQQQQLEQLEASLRELKESKILIESLRTQLDAALTSLASIPQSQSQSSSPAASSSSASSSQTSFPRPRNPNLEAEVNEAMSFLFSSSPDHSQGSKNEELESRIDQMEKELQQHTQEFETALSKKELLAAHLTKSLRLAENQLEECQQQLSNILKSQQNIIPAVVVCENNTQLDTPEYTLSLENEITQLRHELKELSSEYDDSLYVERQNTIRLQRLLETTTMTMTSAMTMRDPMTIPKETSHTRHSITPSDYENLILELDNTQNEIVDLQTELKSTLVNADNSHGTLRRDTLEKITVAESLLSELQSVQQSLFIAPIDLTNANADATGDVDPNETTQMETSQESSPRPSEYLYIQEISRLKRLLEQTDIELAAVVDFARGMQVLQQAKLLLEPHESDTTQQSPSHAPAPAGDYQKKIEELECQLKELTLKGEENQLTIMKLEDELLQALQTKLSSQLTDLSTTIDDLSPTRSWKDIAKKFESEVMQLKEMNQKKDLELEVMLQTLSDLKQQLHEVENLAKETQYRLDATKSSTESESDYLQRLQNDLSEMRREIIPLTETNKELELMKSSLQNELEMAHKELNIVTPLLNQKNEELTQALTLNTSLEQELKKIQTDLKNQLSYQNEIERELDHYRREMKEWVVESQLLETLLSQQQQSLDKLTNEKINLNNQIFVLENSQLQYLYKKTSHDFMRNVENEIMMKRLQNRVMEMSKEEEYHVDGLPSPEDYILIGRQLHLQRKNDSLNEIVKSNQEIMTTLEMRTSNQMKEINEKNERLEAHEKTIQNLEKNYLNLQNETEKVWNNLQTMVMTLIPAANTSLENENENEKNNNTILHLNDCNEIMKSIYESLIEERRVKSTLCQRLDEEIMNKNNVYADFIQLRDAAVLTHLQISQQSDQIDSLVIQNKSLDQQNTQRKQLLQKYQTEEISSLVMTTLLTSQRNELNRLLGREMKSRNELINLQRKNENNIQNLNEKIENYENEILILNETKSENEKTIATLDHQLAALQSDYSNLQISHENLQQVSKNQQNEITHSLQQIEIFEMEQKEMKELIQMKDKEYQELQAALKETDGILEQAVISLRRLELNYQTLQSENEGNKHHLSELEESNRDLNDLLMKQFNEIRELKSNLTEREGEIVFLKSTIDELRSEMTSLRVTHEQDLAMKSHYETEINELKSHLNELQGILEEKEKIITRYAEQRKLQDPWGFSRESGKRFTVMSTGSRNPSTISHERLYLDPDDRIDLSSSIGSGYRGIKNLQNGALHLSDDDLHDESTALSSHVEELCLGSVPAKSFLVAAKSTIPPDDNSSAHSLERPVSPNSRLFPSINSSRDHNFETDYAPSPAKAHRERREPFKTFLEQPNNNKAVEGGNNSSVDKYGQEEDVPITIRKTSKLPPPLKQSNEPTFEKLFFPRDPNKSKNNEEQPVDERRAKSSDSSVSSRSKLSPERPATQHSYSANHLKTTKKGPTIDTSGGGGASSSSATSASMAHGLKPVQSSPALFADGKRRVLSANEAADVSPSPVSGGTISTTAPKRKSRIPVKSPPAPSTVTNTTSRHSNVKINTDSSLIDENHNASSISSSNHSYGCRGTEQDATNLKIRKNSKPQTEDLEGEPSIGSYKPKKFYPELDWDRRFQKSPFDSAVAPHHPTSQLPSQSQSQSNSVIQTTNKSSSSSSATLASPVKPPPTSQGMKVRTQFGLY